MFTVQVLSICTTHGVYALSLTELAASVLLFLATYFDMFGTATSAQLSSTYLITNISTSVSTNKDFTTVLLLLKSKPTL